MDQGVRERAADLMKHVKAQERPVKKVTLKNKGVAVFRTEYRLDVFMKRIVLLVGGVETLAYFSIQMGNEWKRMGYKVFYFDLEDEMNSAKKLRRFIKPGETVLVTFNFEASEKE